MCFGRFKVDGDSWSISKLYLEEQKVLLGTINDVVHINLVTVPEYKPGYLKNEKFFL